MRGCFGKLPGGCRTKAAGPDAWGFGELKRLPVAAFGDLARALHVFEIRGLWPAGLTGAVVVQVPKDGATDATGLRPIGLLASVYRLWAAARMGEIRGRQASASADTLGGRSGRQCGGGRFGGGHFR